MSKEMFEKDLSFQIGLFRFGIYIRSSGLGHLIKVWVRMEGWRMRRFKRRMRKMHQDFEQ